MYAFLVIGVLLEHKYASENKFGTISVFDALVMLQYPV